MTFSVIQKDNIFRRSDNVSAIVAEYLSYLCSMFADDGLQLGTAEIGYRFCYIV